MTIELPTLPYDFAALEPAMSTDTLVFHLSHHQRGDFDRIASLTRGTELNALPLEELVCVAVRMPGRRTLYRCAAETWNHNFFWQCLAPADGQRPTGKLAEMIDAAFGSTDQMLAKFKEEAVGHFASGWAWLILDGGALKITSLHDGDTPAAHDGMQPLLTVDVWEHAYYIDYRNARPAFVDAVLNNLVNWEFVAQNLDGGGVRRADQEG